MKPHLTAHQLAAYLLTLPDLPLGILYSDEGCEGVVPFTQDNIYVFNESILISYDERLSQTHPEYEKNRKYYEDMSQSYTKFLNR